MVNDGDSTPLVSPTPIIKPNSVDIETGTSDQMKCRICLDSDGPLSRIIYAKPFTCIIHNLPYTEDGHGKVILSYSLDWLIGLIRLAGLNLVQTIYPDNYVHDGFGRCALIEFGRGEVRECFRQARKLERAFYNNDSSRLWFDHDDQRVGPYLWVANESDRLILLSILHREGRSAEQRTVSLKWENDSVDWAKGERDIYGDIVSEFKRMV